MMNRYEIIKALLNETDFKKVLNECLECSNAEMILDEHTSSSYLLVTKVIDDFDGNEVLRYAETFELVLDERGRVKHLLLRSFEGDSVIKALEYASIGKIITDYLKFKLN